MPVNARAIFSVSGKSNKFSKGIPFQNSSPPILPEMPVRQLPRCHLPRDEEESRLYIGRPFYGFG